MIKKELHSHTTFCDGNNTPEEMVKAAIEKGFLCRYMAAPQDHHVILSQFRNDVRSTAPVTDIHTFHGQAGLPEYPLEIRSHAVIYRVFLRKGRDEKAARSLSPVRDQFLHQSVRGIKSLKGRCLRASICPHRAACHE